ncbi:MAG: hypothetical protein IT449_01560 [Phycisphaerales bacterium]|nr:hypothetical protein [Phycisphaerales bacterium]
MADHHKLERRQSRFTAVLALCVAGAALLGGAGLPAQEGPPPAAPLAVKQDMIRDRLDRFRDRVFRLQQELSAQEPENAERLARALNRLGEIGATDKLAELVERLGKGENLHDTLGLQEQTVADLEVVLAVLLQRDSQNQERKEEIDRLKERLKQLSELLDRQREVRDQTAQQKQAAELAEQLEQAQALLAEQEQLSKDTAKNAEASSPPWPLEAQKQAQRQGELAERVRELEAKVRKAAADAASQSAPQEAASQDPVPLNASPQDSTKPDSTPPQATPPNATPRGASPPDAKLPDAGSQQPQQPGAAPPESAAQQGEEGQPPSSGKEASESSKTEQAAKSLDAAAKEMKTAQKALGESQSDAAKEAQEQAEEALRRAIHALQEAQKELPKQESAELERQQRALAEDAGKLSGDPNSPQEGGTKQEPQDSPQPGASQPSPSSDNVERAEREMWDAAEKLERQEPDPAVEKQDRAIDALKEAKRELEEALQQKRREEREEMLRDLEARFHDLAVKQKRLNDETISLDGVGAASFARAEQLRAAELADTQGKLAAAVDTCLHILEEEGTTVVFPRILEQVAVDMRLVAERLTALATGALTQAMQKEVLEALEQLLDSVRRMQQENQKQDEQQPSASPTDQNSPLLPTSAELKLLRSAQARVHERTEAIEKARTLETSADDVLSKTIEATAQRQKDCADIARQLRERTEQE